ncbi:hypothetical protein E0H26_25235 [Micromonospora zingiberis]|uniref:Uncharacterized protein n=1 Tax=Micromonospora zingiberis TaxID=2053011 RepID=A0A4V2LV67_9ACTN|nr:hypothetical protein E0H26_25235 [Micromonospora zingiberis]
MRHQLPHAGFGGQRRHPQLAGTPTSGNEREGHGRSLPPGPAAESRTCHRTRTVSARRGRWLRHGAGRCRPASSGTVRQINPASRRTANTRALGNLALITGLLVSAITLSTGTGSRANSCQGGVRSAR